MAVLLVHTLYIIFQIPSIYRLGYVLTNVQNQHRNATEN